MSDITDIHTNDDTPTVDTAVDTADDTGFGSPVNSPRRRFLRRAGQAGTVAAGVVAGGVLLPRPAAAADGDALTVGQANDAESPTALVGGADSNSNVFTVSDGATTSDRPSVVGAFAQGDEVDNGLYAFSAAGHAIIARGGPNARSSVLLVPSLTNPTTQLEAHETGEVIADDEGNLWHCVAAGLPGSFRQISGPATAGAFVPINPVRVYDARFPSNVPEDGPLPAGENRLIPTRDALDVEAGTVTAFDAVPPGAFAISYNVAVFTTTGTGFLFVAPADEVAVKAASINWSEQSPGPLSNASTVKVEQDRQIRVFCGGSDDASCQFTIDVVGYYR